MPVIAAGQRRLDNQEFEILVKESTEGGICMVIQVLTGETRKLIYQLAIYTRLLKGFILFTPTLF